MIALRGKVLIIAIVAFVVGGTVTASVLYAVYRPISRLVANMPFDQAASSGRLYATILSDLRRGDSAKATNMLETMLDGEIITLSLYEDSIRPSERQPSIYAAAGQLRKYRLEVPSLSNDPEVLRAIGKGLDLGVSGEIPKANGP